MLIPDLKDPRLRGITLTGVRMTDDLRHGRVFFRIEYNRAPPSRSRVSEARQDLSAARGRVSASLCAELESEFDPGPGRAARIDVLLRSARKD